MDATPQPWTGIELLIVAHSCELGPRLGQVFTCDIDVTFTTAPRRRERIDGTSAATSARGLQ